MHLLDKAVVNSLFESLDRETTNDSADQLTVGADTNIATKSHEQLHFSLSFSKF